MVFVLAGCGEAQSNTAASSSNTDTTSITASNSFATTFQENNFTKIVDTLDSGKEVSISKQESVEKICSLMAQLEALESTQDELEEAAIDGGTQLAFLSDNTTVTVQFIGEFVTLQNNNEKPGYYKIKNKEAKDQIFNIIDNFL